MAAARQPVLEPAADPPFRRNGAEKRDLADVVEN
jgi:hypothetical protein